MSYPKLPENQYKKLLFQARGQLNAIWNSCRCYGLNELVDGNIEETMRIVENFGQAVRGDNKPIHILQEPKRRITE